LRIDPIATGSRSGSTNSRKLHSSADRTVISIRGLVRGRLRQGRWDCSLKALRWPLMQLLTRSGASKCSSAGSGIDFVHGAGNCLLGWLFEARSWVSSSAGNRQRYRSERPADLGSRQRVREDQCSVNRNFRRQDRCECAPKFRRRGENERLVHRHRNWIIFLWSSIFLHRRSATGLCHPGGRVVAIDLEPGDA
jgi:hypothetical protein